MDYRETKHIFLFTGEVPIRSRYARLIVLMPPEPPKITQGAILNAVEDRDVNLECISTGGRPASEVDNYFIPYQHHR